MNARVFSINVDGLPRRLFTIQEKSSGDLTIILKNPIFLGSPLIQTPETAKRITEYRWSLHISPNKGDFSEFKFTIKAENAPEQNPRVFTRVIKQPGNYSPVFYFRSANLHCGHALFNPLKKYPESISLGNLEPKGFQLILGVYAAHGDVNAVWTRKGGVRAAHASFSRMNISVLWNFWPVPANGTTSLTIPDNSKGYLDKINATETERKLFDQLSYGIHPGNLINDFRPNRVDLVDRFRRDYWSETDKYRMIANKFLYEFYTDCMPGTSEYTRCARSLIQAVSGLTQEEKERFIKTYHTFYPEPEIEV